MRSRGLAAASLATLLLFTTGSARAAVYTVCTGKAYSWNSAAPGTIGYGPMENLRSKLGNLEFFGPTGSAAPDVLHFATPLTGITPAALEGGGCDIWFSGDDTSWSTDEKLALGRWVNASDTRFVIAACNGDARGEVCRAVGMPAEAPVTPLESKNVLLSAIPNGNPLRCARLCCAGLCCAVLCYAALVFAALRSASLECQPHTRHSAVARLFAKPACRALRCFCLSFSFAHTSGSTEAQIGDCCDIPIVAQQLWWHL